MSKRAKFVIASLLITFLLWGTRFLIPDHRLAAMVSIVVLSYLVSAWVLFEDLKGVEWLTLLLLPTLYTLSAGIYSLFLPEFIPQLFGTRLDLESSKMLAALVRSGFWIVFAIGFYAIYLTENIFSVAAIRTIQLLRAAHTVGFLMTLVVGFFLFQSILSFRINFWLIGIAVFVTSFLLFLQGMWSAQLKEGVTKRVVSFSLVGSLIMAELAMVLSFWPLNVLTGALMMISGKYLILGLSQNYLSGRFFKNQIYEFVGVALVVLLVGFFATSWR